MVILQKVFLNLFKYFYTYYKPTINLWLRTLFLDISLTILYQRFNSLQLTRLSVKWYRYILILYQTTWNLTIKCVFLVKPYLMFFFQMLAQCNFFTLEMHICALCEWFKDHHNLLLQCSWLQNDETFTFSLF